MSSVFVCCFVCCVFHWNVTIVFLCLHGCFFTFLSVFPPDVSTLCQCLAASGLLDCSIYLHFLRQSLHTQEGCPNVFVVLFSRSLVGNLPGRRSNFLPVQHLPIPLSLKNGAEFKTIFPICVSMELFFQFAFTDASVTLHLSCITKCILELWLHCCLLIATGNSVNHCFLST